MNAPAEKIVRIAVAVILGLHGAHRAVTGGYLLFGQFLAAKGFPAGTGLAALITIGELVGAAALLLNRGVFWACCGHAVVLAGGIVLVHAPAGWFVVGAGRNGVEFSVLLLACLAALAWPHRPWRREAAAPSTLRS
ncbi:MAG: DoxX family protein [Opitutus sp.]|nr:DoxX family protein [Opitutus sp.]